MKKNLLLAGAICLFAAAGPLAPAWGQRIRFAQSAGLEASPSSEEEPQAASQPAKPDSSPPHEALPAPDPRPAAPAPESKSSVDSASSPPLAQRFLPGELPPGAIVETPPPYFLESEPAFPLAEGFPYPPSSCGPDCYSLFPPDSGFRLPCFSPFRWMRGLSCGQRVGVFGEYLYLRPRDAETAIAVPGQAPVVMAGNPTIAVPQGRTVLLDPDYSPGFRAGVNVRLKERTSFQVAYTWFESDAVAGRTLSAAEIAQNIALFPLLLHPRSALPNNVTNVSVDGRMDVEFEIIDADARLILWDGQVSRLTGYVGARYAELEQELQTVYSINTGTVVEAVTDFEGAGARLGLDGRGSLECWGLGVYGRSELSLLYGYSRAAYRQYQLNNPANPQIFTDWQAGRINPVYEFELGLEWLSPRERLRLSAGYMASVWFNMVTMEDYLESIQQNQFDDQGDTLTFDGLTARVEIRL
ncbi:MAG: hypothetical protein KY475_08605 [Planctomycetes bacterium]|nr:hypothetical protein [Planctomycetota bacterium]